MAPTMLTRVVPGGGVKVCGSLLGLHSSAQAPAGIGAPSASRRIHALVPQPRTRSAGSAPTQLKDSSTSAVSGSSSRQARLRAAASSAVAKSLIMHMYRASEPIGSGWVQARV